MNIGMAPFSELDLKFLGSIQRVERATHAAIAGEHTLVPYPNDDPSTPRAHWRERLASWVASCDVIIGPLNRDILDSRQSVKRPVPFACFLLGSLSRGAWGLSTAWRYLRTSDALIVNCTSDATIARKFCPNATVQVVPFAFDEERFFRSDSASQTAARQALGLSNRDKLVLYSGRITLEKNVQTLFRTFKVVQNVLPNVSLVLAGDEMNTPFQDFGAIPLSIKRSLRHLRAHLEIQTGRVLLIGQRSSDDLRSLYSTADILVNLTLNHDENFGLSQIEAMACGLPCVGSAWGGLKDTIDHGVTGAHVPTIVTEVGTKVDWWSAANAIVQILTMDESEMTEMRRRCQELARERYSASRYRDNLNQLLTDCLAATAQPTEPLRVSGFAEEYWAHCKWDIDLPPPYRRGQEGLRLYRELITSFAESGIPGSVLPHGGVWYLPVPIAMPQPGIVAIDDLIFPLEMPVPRDLVEGTRKLVDRFTEHPVQPQRLAFELDPEEGRALEWMHKAGLVLRSAWTAIDAKCASGGVGRPAFRTGRLDFSTDVITLS